MALAPWDPPSSRQAAAIEALPAQGSSGSILDPLLPGAQPHQSKASVATMAPYLASPLSLPWGVQVRLGLAHACSPLHPRRCKLRFRHHMTAFICQQAARARAPCMLSNIATPPPTFPRRGLSHATQVPIAPSRPQSHPWRARPGQMAHNTYLCTPFLGHPTLTAHISLMPWPFATKLGEHAPQTGRYRMHVLRGWAGPIC